MFTHLDLPVVDSRVCSASSLGLTLFIVSFLMKEILCRLTPTLLCSLLGLFSFRRATADASKHGEIGHTRMGTWDGWQYRFFGVSSVFRSSFFFFLHILVSFLLMFSLLSCLFSVFCFCFSCFNLSFYRFCSVLCLNFFVFIFGLFVLCCPICFFVLCSPLSRTVDRQDDEFCDRGQKLVSVIWLPLWARAASASYRRPLACHAFTLCVQHSNRAIHLYFIPQHVSVMRSRCGCFSFPVPGLSRRRSSQ